MIRRNNSRVKFFCKLSSEPTRLQNSFFPPCDCPWQRHILIMESLFFRNPPNLRIRLGITAIFMHQTEEKLSGEIILPFVLNINTFVEMLRFGNENFVGTYKFFTPPRHVCCCEYLWFEVLVYLFYLFHYGDFTNFKV